ncbi:MAG: hypothetical protein KCHDKBKB_02981 [Elusimicrobia bacterium]|nr:hypothetical protein [Elusimicrobiota bacterium]
MSRSKTKSDSFAVFDLETDYIKKAQKPSNNFACYAYYAKDEQFFTRDEKQAFEHLITRKVKYIYAHFGGRFDFLWMLKIALSAHKKRVTFKRIILIGSSLAEIQIVRDKQTITFRDSFRILPDKLANIAKTFGDSKVDIDFSKERNKDEEKQRAIKDCELLYRALERFWGLCKSYSSRPAITIAAQSMDIFRRGFCAMKKPLVEHENVQREAYYGGRTEIYRYKNANIIEYDINSLYPFAMRERAFPVGHCITASVDEAQISGFVKNGFCGYAHCAVEAPDMNYPILPVRVKGRLFFPTGKFSGTWTIHELEYARRNGYKLSSITCTYYQKTERIFADFISHFYAERKASKDDFERLFYKLLMNSLYGKFGMRRERNGIAIADDFFAFMERWKRENVDIATTGKLPELINAELGIFYTTEYLQSEWIYPLWAAYVTSYSRIYHHSIYRLCEGLAMVDTDSFHCSNLRDGIGELTTNECNEYVSGQLIGPEIGQIKVVGKYAKANYLAPKVYELTNDKGTTRKAKGVPRDLLNEPGARLDSKHEFVYDGVLSFKESLRHAKDFFSIERKTKRLTLVDAKRKRNGNLSTPFGYAELDK